jgi:hypothetical protein
MTELEQEIAHLQELRAKHRKNIHRLEEQLATYGKADAPLHLFNKLDSEREQLRQIEEELKTLATQAETEVAAVTPAELREVRRKEKPTIWSGLPIWGWGIIALVAALIIGGAIFLAIQRGEPTVRPTPMAQATAITATITATPMVISTSSPIYTPPPTETPTPTTTPSPIPTSTPVHTPSPVAVSPIPAFDSVLIAYAVATPVEYQEITPSPYIKLRQFELAKSATSYIQTREWFGPVGPGPELTTFRVDDALMDHIQWEGCTGEVDTSLPRIKEALQNYAQQRGRSELLQYIETEEQVKTLVKDQPDIARKLIPQSAEWLELSRPDYEAYILWLSSCVGIPFPVFTVTIENLTDQEQLITKVLYRTEKTISEMGGYLIPLTPSVTYVHEIAWMVGDQEVALDPAFPISPKSSASFQLQLTTKAPDLGMIWLMRICLVIDAERGGVCTDEFQLVMSGKPEWG